MTKFAKYEKLIILIYGIIKTAGSYANYNNPYINIETGLGWIKQGQDQLILIKDLIGDQLTDNSGQKIQGVVGLGIMFNIENKNSLINSIGIKGYYLSGTSITGIITQEKLFDNLSYKYSNTNLPFYLDLRSTINKKIFNKFALSFDIGAGPNIIITKNYQEFPLNTSSIPSTNLFNNNVSTDFSFTAGFTININEDNKKLPIDCGYRFFYLGEGLLKTNNQEILNTLKTGYNFSHAITCSISTSPKLN